MKGYAAALAAALQIGVDFIARLEESRAVGVGVENILRQIQQLGLNLLGLLDHNTETFDGERRTVYELSLERYLIRSIAFDVEIDSIVELGPLRQRALCSTLSSGTLGVLCAMGETKFSGVWYSEGKNCALSLRCRR